jgi:TetR/AcrR family transcriptional regulator
LQGGIDVQKLSRREREKLSRRAEILQAAWEVFASKDYGSATIDQIAEAAELSKGTLYLYFQNKADIFLSTVEMGLEMISSIIQETTSSIDDPVAGLKEIIKRLLDFSEENAGFFKIMSSEQAHFEIHAEMVTDRNFKGRIMASVSRNTSIIADYLQRGMEMGAFKHVNPKDAAFVLLSVIRAFAFRQIIEPTEVKLSEKSETIFAILMDGLRKGNSISVNGK